MTQAITPWRGPEGISIPSTLSSVSDIVRYGAQLSNSDQTKIIQAFEFRSFDMASEFVWRRTMSKLKNILSSLGMSFIGEMLNRDDIDDFSPIETVLTDYDAIRLAESLGVISQTGAMKLRHAFESIAHFSNPQISDELDCIEALSIIKTSIQFVLGDEDTYVPLDFKTLRDRLVSIPINLSDSQIDQLINSPTFYISTALRVILSAIKALEDAKLENTLANLNTILPSIWEKLTEEDRFLVGKAYAQISSIGKTTAIAGLKNALIKVKGFDYVPENLRSGTYNKIAQAILDAHFGFSNYYAEPAPVKRLSQLGTSIPRSAIPKCMQALLCVYLGNRYGFSFEAEPVAEEQLKSITLERWQYYFDKILISDDTILLKLLETNPRNRFFEMFSKINLCSITPQHPLVNKLFHAVCTGRNDNIFEHVVKTMLQQIGK